MSDYIINGQEGPSEQCFIERQSLRKDPAISGDALKNPGNEA